MKSVWRGHDLALPVQLTKEELQWMRDEFSHEAEKSGREVLCVIKEQKHGDLFLIPTGLPHSVANGDYSIIKIASDIVDPRKADIMARNAVIQKKIIPHWMGIGQAEDYSSNTEVIHTAVGNQVFTKVMAHNTTAKRFC